MSTVTIEKPLDGVDDKELFDAALSTDADTSTEQPEQAVTTAEPEAKVDDGPARDEHGRFASKETPEAQPEAKAPEQPAPAQTAQQHIVPLPVYLQEREQRQEFQRKWAESQAQLRQYTEKPKEAPDPYADPLAAIDHRLDPVRQELGSQIAQVKDGISKTVAVDKYGEQAVQSAYAEMEKHVQQFGPNSPDYQRVMHSAHPYGELVKWSKEQETRSKIGNDLDGFLQKHNDSLLNDPAFMAKVAEKLRQPNGAQSSGQPGSRPVVQIPPSLNKVASASARDADTVGDLSNESLFANAMR